jgi:hypothetical protein
LVTALISIILAVTLNYLFFIPAAIYGIFLILASLLTGKGIIEKILLPIVLFTMQMSWGLGFLTSPKTLAPSER